MIITEYNLKDNEKLSSKEEIEKDYPVVHDFLEFFSQQYVITKNEEKGIYKIHLFTDNYEYTIIVFENYCGGFTTVRKHGIMENWDRGNDLVDGVPSQQLFTKIALYMIKNELIGLGEIEFKNSSEIFGPEVTKQKMENNFLMEKPNNERLKHCMVKIFKGVSMHDYMVNSFRDDWCRFKFPENVKEKIINDEYYKVWFTYKEDSDPMSSECLYTVKYIERCREDIEQFLIEKEKFEPLIIDYLKK